MPASPSKFLPPAISTSSGTQLPHDISGSIHSRQAIDGRVLADAATPQEFVEFVLQRGDERLGPLGAPNDWADGADADPDVGQRHRGQGHNLRRPLDADHVGHRLLDVFEADRAAPRTASA